MRTIIIRSKFLTSDGIRNLWGTKERPNISLIWNWASRIKSYKSSLNNYCIIQHISMKRCHPGTPFGFANFLTPTKTLGFNKWSSSLESITKLILKFNGIKIYSWQQTNRGGRGGIIQREKITRIRMFRLGGIRRSNLGKYLRCWTFAMC